MDCQKTISKVQLSKNPNHSILYQFVTNLKLTFGFIAINVFTVVSPITVTAQEGIDSVGIKGLVNTYQNAWNTHSPSAIAKFFLKDADMVFDNFQKIQGRQAIEEWWQNYFNKQEPELNANFTISSIKFLTHNVALVEIEYMSGNKNGVNNELPIRKVRSTWLLKRNQNYWLISAMRSLPTIEDRVELVASIKTTELLRPQIRALVADYEDTFNLHDPEALSKFYTADADIIIREQYAIYGTNAIKYWWQTYFSQPRPYRALIIIDEIRMLSENVALLNITATGASLEATEHLVPTRKTRATWILLREDGKWLITALRILPGKYDRVIRH
jgi:uncharacterized protein (TIGR02246 family)